MTLWGSWDGREKEEIREIRKNNKECRAWELKDKNRTRMNNHQYQSQSFDNTNSRSPKCGEGPK